MLWSFLYQHDIPLDDMRTNLECLEAQAGSFAWVCTWSSPAGAGGPPVQACMYARAVALEGRPVEGRGADIRVDRRTKG